MLKSKIVTPRQFIPKLLSRQSVTITEMERFSEKTVTSMIRMKRKSR